MKRKLISLLILFALPLTLLGDEDYMLLRTGAGNLNETGNPVKLRVNNNGDGTYTLTVANADGSAIGGGVGGGGLTNTELRATPVPTSISNWPGTQAVSLATAPVLVAGSAIIGKVGIDQTTPGTTNAITNFGFNGATYEALRVANISKDLSAVTIDSIATVWTPTSGKKFRLMGGTISVSAAMSVLFEDNAAAAFVFRTPKIAADTPYSFVVNGGQGKLSAATNNVLKATGSAAGTITGTLYGTEE